MRKTLNKKERALIIELGKSIRTFRKERNISQDGLAERSGIDRRSISDIENGKSNLSFTTLHKIVTSLQMPSDFLFYPKEDIESPALQQILVDIKDCNEAEREALARCLAFYKAEMHRK